MDESRNRPPESGDGARSPLVVGVVLHEDGQPASGATVFLDKYFMPLGEHDYGNPPFRMPVRDEDGVWSWDTPQPPQHAPQRTTTDERGRYAFEATDALREDLGDERVKIWAERGDLVAAKVLLRASDRPAQAATLRLGAALRPMVQLVDERGDPVLDAVVNLHLHVEDESGNSVEELLYSIGARPNERGIAILPAIPARSDWEVWLRVNAKKRPQYLDTDYAAAQLRSPDPVRVQLPAGCIVRGRVELPDGAAAGSGVSVSARHDPIDPNPGGENATLIDDDGAFELHGVPTKAVLTFTELPADSSPETLFFGNTEGARLTRKVQAAEGEVVDLGIVRLPAAASISGVVLDKNGEPASNGHVMLDFRGAFAGPSCSRPIDPDGTFEIGGLEAGLHTITATIYEGERSLDDPFRGELEGRLEDVPTGSKDVVIHVTGGGNLIVRLHPLGRPDVPLVVRRPGVRGGT